MFNTGLLAPFLTRARRSSAAVTAAISDAAQPSAPVMVPASDDAVQMLTPAPPEMRKFSSLKEFDEFDRELLSGSYNDVISILSNSYYEPPELYEMPSDPFSDEYTAAVLKIHADISGRAHYDAGTMEATPVTYEHMIATPAAYTDQGKSLGNYLESYGQLIQKLEIQSGMSIVEFGCGDAEISLHLARAGCAVTVVDIEQTYIDVVREKAQRFHVPIEAICAGFGADIGSRAFDRAFFYQSFHHAIDHRGMLTKLGRMLKSDGIIVFGTEPIIDPAGPWRHAVPYPWGPRLDGLSLRAMRSYGWMELGFQEGYFFEMLDRQEWTHEMHKSDTNGLVFNIVAKRR